MTPKTKMEWMETKHIQAEAGKQADALVARLGITAPIDPLFVAKTEYPLLRAGGSDLGNRYDGKLEYHRSKNTFLLFYNTKYDHGIPAGKHHPRTRFSISHELGHFFLDHHHRSLRHGGKSHRSFSEFLSLQKIEREADAFAAHLLLPTSLARPVVNREALSLDKLGEIARQFETSLVSTAIRSVQLSDFPCAVAGIRDGSIAWMLPSDSLIAAGIYPRSGTLPHESADSWNRFAAGNYEPTDANGEVGNWFQTFDREELDDIYVREEYQPVASMETLLVLLTLDENDLATDEDDEVDEDDE